MRTIRFVVFWLFATIALFGCKTYKVTLSWDQQGYATVSGHKLYCGTTSKNYTLSMDLGKLSPIQIFPDGSAHYQYQQIFNDTQYRKYTYLAMTAYNTTKESGYSNEINLKALVAKVEETMALPRPELENLRITIEEVK